MLESFIDTMQAQYGSFQDHEVNMIQSIIEKSRNRIIECCNSEEFIESLFYEGEEAEDGATEDGDGSDDS